jgi:hypothetical protein
MIKATATLANGRNLLVVGLSFANLKRFREQPRDTFIRIEGAEIDLPVDVIIFSGESEAALARLLAQFLGPDTQVRIDPRTTDG